MSRGEPLALISRAVAEGARANLIYRDKPISPEDTGWRAFTGSETGAEMADPANTVLAPLSRLTEAAPDAAPYLSAPRGTALERDEAGRLVDVSDVGKARWEIDGRTRVGAS